MKLPRLRRCAASRASPPGRNCRGSPSDLTRVSLFNSHYWDAGLAAQHLRNVLNVPHVHTPHSLGWWKQRQMEYDDHRFFPVSDASRAAIRQRLGFEGKVILALGRLARNKGYDLLIDSFRLVAERVPDAILHLAVGGSELNENVRAILQELHERAEKTGHAHRIHFGSFIADADLADYYRAADLFVLSSRYEPFGMTAIEAMASGTPTVVTVHGGLFRALSFGRHALFADPFDREDLGIMMAKVFRHPRLRMRLALMGSHKARSLFTWTGIAHQLVAAVEQRVTVASTCHETDWDEPWNDGD